MSEYSAFVLGTWRIADVLPPRLQERYYLYRAEVHLAWLELYLLWYLGFIGANISKKIAHFLEENDLFVPSDDDEDDVDEYMIVFLRFFEWVSCVYSFGMFLQYDD